MTPAEYLKKILESQTLAEDGPELKALRDKRDEVEKHLRDEFAAASPTIRYGGSKAKGTMIKEAYDLDVICYFERDSTAAGETLADIYENVRKALAKKYTVISKPSALRLQGASYEDFHVDVVPGRFVDDAKADAFLHRTTGDKERLKTNLQKHIDHVRDSGCADAIRLLKLWRCRDNLRVKHFALEVLTIELLEGKKGATLADQLTHVWTELRDRVDSITIKDPANPSGNDLSELLDDSIRAELKNAALAALDTVARAGWESVFGPLSAENEGRAHVRIEAPADARPALRAAAASVRTPTRPWCP